MHKKDSSYPIPRPDKLRWWQLSCHFEASAIEPDSRNYFKTETQQLRVSGGSFQNWIICQEYKRIRYWQCFKWWALSFASFEWAITDWSEESQILANSNPLSILVLWKIFLRTWSIRRPRCNENCRSNDSNPLRGPQRDDCSVICRLYKTGSTHVCTEDINWLLAYKPDFMQPCEEIMPLPSATEEIGRNWAWVGVWEAEKSWSRRGNVDPTLGVWLTLKLRW